LLLSFRQEESKRAQDEILGISAEANPPFPEAGAKD
jgi:hypothetical protein